MKLGKEDYFSTLKQSYPDFEEIIRTQAIFVEYKTTNLKELTMLYLKNDVLLLTDIFQIYIDTCKKLMVLIHYIRIVHHQSRGKLV